MKFDDIRVGDRLRVEKKGGDVIEFTVTKITGGVYVWSGRTIHLHRTEMDFGVAEVTLLERTVKYHSMYRVWLNPVDPPVYAILRRGADGDAFVYGDTAHLNVVIETPLDQVEKYEEVQQ